MDWSSNYALRSLPMARVWIISKDYICFFDYVLLTPDQDHESKHLLNYLLISALNLDFFGPVESLVVGPAGLVRMISQAAMIPHLSAPVIDGVCVPKHRRVRKLTQYSHSLPPISPHHWHWHASSVRVTVSAVRVEASRAT